MTAVLAVIVAAIGARGDVLSAPTELDGHAFATDLHANHSHSGHGMMSPEKDGISLAVSDLGEGHENHDTCNALACCPILTTDAAPIGSIAEAHGIRHWPRRPLGALQIVPRRDDKPPRLA